MVAEEHVRRKLLRLWVMRVSNALSCLRRVVGNVPKLNIRTQQEPIRTGSPNGHPHASSVYHTCRPNHSIELHVRMTADNEAASIPSKTGKSRFSGVETSQALIFVSRRRMAKQHLAQPVDLEAECFRPGG